MTSPAKSEAGDYLRAFLAHCAEGENSATGGNGTRLDFITFHTKGGRYRTDIGAAKQTPSIETLLGHVRAGLGIIDEFPGFRRLEVNLSECDPDGWAAGSKHDNPNLIFRNTEYYASFLAMAACRLIDLNIDGMVTWAFQFEDREYFEGLRCLSTNGIDKPVLNVFRLLARLGGTRLAVSDDGSGNRFNVGAIAAEDQSGSIRVFGVAHHDDWDAEDKIAVKVHFKGLQPEKSYSVVSYLISREESNSHTAWTALGEPQPPSSEQLIALREAARLKPRDHRALTPDSAGGSEIEFGLEGHSVWLLEITPKV